MFSHASKTASTHVIWPAQEFAIWLLRDLLNMHRAPPQHLRVGMSHPPQTSQTGTQAASAPKSIAPESMSPVVVVAVMDVTLMVAVVVAEVVEVSVLKVALLVCVQPRNAPAAAEMPRSKRCMRTMIAR
jgi:hypothetical protein